MGAIRPYTKTARTAERMSTEEWYQTDAVVVGMLGDDVRQNTGCLLAVLSRDIAVSDQPHVC